ncbi:ABC transporter substrate-binding protein [Paenibacillus whitsoniae]|uniref:ABC transporter substrate-binding protein n=1 Tax=Paenibacillus whitsoniae TaxID=2496558 RepID=A0A430JJ67_9BACL|nr:ABC transporter substrate-binding protein [Paenibacillus whitsoniae]RTE10996.1 ABC transporter substrate-binding protein [Paenibacillus whitsoniae]
MLKNWYLIGAACLVMSLSLLGCSSSSTGHHDASQAPSSSSTAATAASPAVSPTPTTASEIRFKDSKGQEIVLTQKPQRVVLLNTEVQELFYQVGGKAVGLATAPGIPVPEQAKDAVQVGQINQVSMEQIMNLNPDLVIGQSMFHASLKDTLAASKVPLALIDINSYDDIKKAAELFGKLAGTASTSQGAIAQTDAKIKAITDKLPAQNPKYAMITIMPMGISVQKNGAISIDAANRLKLKNVADLMEAGMMPSSAPFSLEKLAQLDPDYLFFIVHGTEAYGKEKLKTDIASNPAWGSLRAVKENKIYFLPSQLFVTNPGLQFDESLSYLAKLAYPDAFK